MFIFSTTNRKAKKNGIGVSFVKKFAYVLYYRLRWFIKQNGSHHPFMNDFQPLCKTEKSLNKESFFST